MAQKGTADSVRARHSEIDACDSEIHFFRDMGAKALNSIPDEGAYFPSCAAG
jgi:hypothetical protein